jgi:hypothetical protein
MLIATLVEKVLVWKAPLPVLTKSPAILMELFEPPWPETVTPVEVLTMSEPVSVTLKEALLLMNMLPAFQ